MGPLATLNRRGTIAPFESRRSRLPPSIATFSYIELQVTSSWNKNGIDLNLRGVLLLRHVLDFAACNECDALSPRLWLVGPSKWTKEKKDLHEIALRHANTCHTNCYLYMSWNIGMHTVRHYGAALWVLPRVSRDPARSETASSGVSSCFRYGLCDDRQPANNISYGRPLLTWRGAGQC